MPYTGGQIVTGQVEQLKREKKARAHVELQGHLGDMEERYNRHVRAGTTHHPAAKYLLSTIKDAKRQLRGR